MADKDLFPPKGTGESLTGRGEDLAKSKHEPGRTDLGKDDQGRTLGGSSARMTTGVDPLDAVDPAVPKKS